MPSPDNEIKRSWSINARAWTSAIRNHEIQSRRDVTNAAIIKAVIDHEPTRVLDLGCGEGWLARALSHAGIAVTGVDGEPQLIDQARAAGSGDFWVASYEELVAEDLGTPFEVIVANFSLLGESSVNDLFRWVPRQLTPGGIFIIQTLHPFIACGTGPANNLGYIEGWRPGSWDGFSSCFVEPAPWFFRTLEGWVALFTANGFCLTKLSEPLNPETALPASILLHGRKPA